MVRYAVQLNLDGHICYFKNGYYPDDVCLAMFDTLEEAQKNYSETKSSFYLPIKIRIVEVKLQIEPMTDFQDYP